MGAMATTADQQLVGYVESAVGGDQFAFAHIVEALYEHVYSICMIVCRDRSLAEEAAQSTWSQVWRKLDSVKRPDRLRPWVVSVAFNEAKQALRRTRRHSRLTASEVVLDVPGGVDPGTGIAGIDLRLALRDLDPEDRALLTMRYVLGFDATELSTATGLTPSGVRSRLERLVARLRRELA